MFVPEDMEVPLNRRDLDKPDNVRWLLRNLWVKNSKHREFNRLVKHLVKRDLTERCRLSAERKINLLPH